MKINGAALRTIRSRSALTGAELSRRTGIPSETISRLENGQRRGTPEQIAEIARVLRVDVAAITS